MKNQIELQKTYWASVSGGKDTRYRMERVNNYKLTELERW